ncbi:MAG: ATP-grasp domain-containing protein [Lentimicrobiaceae bacterium]|nr:ATP-grasp domain-containing protein [Lentimicrobiaceae bacterium]
MQTRNIHKVLIANRGEIAVRIIRTLKRLHITSVAVFDNNDTHSLHCRIADEARPLGEGELKDTYLNIQKIIDAALDSGAQAIHPGYGMLSENPLFAEACAQNNIIFIGPDSESMRVMGNKIKARTFALENNIPVVEGFTGSLETILQKAETFSYPLLIKAAAGGGGKGIVIVRKAEELESALKKSAREAKNYFGDDRVFVEQYIESPRHIEVQVLADHFGKVLHLFDRECSIQRRYQKIIEEAPSVSISDETRSKMYETAKRICEKIGYKNAGTVEFLVDANQHFYFLEMNTRIQVEHTVTEMITGIDIVEQQIHIASNNPLQISQENLVADGHAIECRIYAENPENEFIPSPGTITLYHEPQKRNVRIDSSIDSETVVSPHYDPMISKLICHTKNRDESIRIAQQALSEYIIQGIDTNNAFLQVLLTNSDFITNNMDTFFCDSHRKTLLYAIEEARKKVPIAAIIAVFLLYDFNKKQLFDRAENIWETIGYWRYHMDVFVAVFEKKHLVKITSKQPGYLCGTIENKPFKVQLVNQNKHQLKILLNGRSETVFVSETSENNTCVHLRGFDFVCSRADQLDQTITYLSADETSETVNFCSPLPGKVIKINVHEGDIVERGTVMLIIEAMKMENSIISPTHAKVAHINVKENQLVDTKMQLIVLKGEK